MPRLCSLDFWLMWSSCQKFGRLKVRSPLIRDIEHSIEVTAETHSGICDDC
jgi:hypothetical protein